VPPAQNQTIPKRSPLPVSATLAALDQLRRKVAQLPADGDSRTMVRFAKEALAENVERTIDRALMSGDPAEADALVRARDKVAKLRATTRRSSRDDTDDTLHRLTDAGATPQHMAAWLAGSTRAQPPIRAIRVAERLKETLPAAEWSTLRQATADRVMQAGAGTPTDSADGFMKFLHGRGERLMTVLFSKNERDLMARIANTVRLQGDAAEPAVKPIIAQLGAILSAQAAT
jgi:hypothetical protein